MHVTALVKGRGPDAHCTAWLSDSMLPRTPSGFAILERCGSWFPPCRVSGLRED